MPVNRLFITSVTWMVVVTAAKLMGCTPPPASAAEAPKWQVTVVASPTNLAPGSSEGALIITAVNIGGAPTDGSTVSLKGALPPGLTTSGEIHGTDVFAGESESENVLSCSSVPLGCDDSRMVDPGDALVMRTRVTVASHVTSTSLPVNATVSGGGAPTAAVVTPITISATPETFGIAPNSLAIGLSSTQAGAHPNVSASFAFNTSSFGQLAGDERDVRFDAPVGLVGDTVALPRCAIGGVLTGGSAPSGVTEGVSEQCPATSMVGTAVVTISEPGILGREKLIATPVYNIAPSPGEPAAFAFKALEFTVRLDTSVLSDGDYGVRLTSPDLTENGQGLATSLTLWGVPADHNGAGSDFVGRLHGARIGGPGSGARLALLSNPTQCSEPLSATLSADPWEDPGEFQSESAVLGTLSACDELPFTSSISVIPDTREAGAPAGYNFDLSVHREDDSEPEGVAASDVRDVTAVLPSGTVISPSAATGLSACSDEEFFGPEAERGLPQPATTGACPAESEIGTVRIKTPALEEALQGNVYLGAPLCNPCTPADAQNGRMVRLLVQATSEGEGGIVVKLEGTASINQQSGQITATFTNNPQLPFSDFTMSLMGGPRATLANPDMCGPATTFADLTPWSTPFTLDAALTSTFEVTGCSAPQFDPSFTAGVTDNQAGAFSPFTVSFGRNDADQDFAGIQMQLPPGLLGLVTSVPPCREPQAAEGTCGLESLIGSTQVLTGVGAEPFLVTGGQVFLTEGYKGAPYGLSIVVPAKAGPYTLSGTTGTGLVVVRAAINVSRTNAALTITTDPLPTILDGIPLALKFVTVTVGRPGFLFNPTNCNPMTVNGTLTSSQGLTAPVSSHFQVTNCAELAFKPAFAVSTSGTTSKTDGASLDAKVTYPSESRGVEANIARVKVDLPRQLPSRLTTLQKACAAAVFEANPAVCPTGSVIGIARASTPVLPVTLTGPVYFVSHGGEAFPSLIIILQGDGVRVDLTGATFIKGGITSSTFGTVPDVPVSSFELYLPMGPHSALSANGDLCKITNTVTSPRGTAMHGAKTRKSSLAMPTEFVAQNGTKIHEETTIRVTGCHKTHARQSTTTKATKTGQNQPKRSL